MKLFLQDCDFAKHASHTERRLLAAISTVLWFVAVIVITWTASQFVPWIGQYVETIFSSVQIGLGLFAIAGILAVIAGIIVWNA